MTTLAIARSSARIWRLDSWSSLISLPPLEDLSPFRFQSPDMVADTELIAMEVLLATSFAKDLAIPGDKY